MCRKPNNFVYATSVWKSVSDRVTQLQRNCATTIFLAIFVFFGYFVTSFSLFANDAAMGTKRNIASKVGENSITKTE